jgi:predicted ATP-grasp superfamily ATP-dependent carboligase
LKVFVCEFVTGGGLYRELLPPSLLVEGAMMRDAALRDFAQIRDIEILMTCDQRLAAPAEAHEVLMVDTQQDVWTIWERCISASDAILLIAPETGGVLERLTQLAERLNKMVFGSKASEVNLSGDKWLTYQSFISHHVPTLDTYLANDLPNSMQGPYICKSRDNCLEISLVNIITFTSLFLLENKINTDSSM